MPAGRIPTKLADGYGWSDKVVPAIGRREINTILSREPALAEAGVDGPCSARHSLAFVELRVELSWRLHSLGYSSLAIGRYLGQDHTTVLHHLQKNSCAVAGSHWRIIELRKARLTWKQRRYYRQQRGEEARVIREAAMAAINAMKHERENRPIKGKWSYKPNPEVGDDYVGEKRLQQRREEAAAIARRPTVHHTSLTAILCGDPLPGRSALDRRGEQEQRYYDTRRQAAPATVARQEARIARREDRLRILGLAGESRAA